MTATLLEMEGTAEEIAERLHGFAERRLYVTVRPVDEEITEPKDTHSIAEVLAEIAAHIQEHDQTEGKKPAPEATPKKKGFLAQLREIKIDAPSDFSENFDLQGQRIRETVVCRTGRL